MVARPVERLRVEDLELEGQDAREEPGARARGLDAGEDRKEVRALGGGLIEEAHARKGGEAEVPELCEVRVRRV